MCVSRSVRSAVSGSASAAAIAAQYMGSAPSFIAIALASVGDSLPLFFALHSAASVMLKSLAHCAACCFFRACSSSSNVVGIDFPFCQWLLLWVVFPLGCFTGCLVLRIITSQLV